MERSEVINAVQLLSGEIIGFGCSSTGTNCPYRLVGLLTGIGCASGGPDYEAGQWDGTGEGSGSSLGCLAFVEPTAGYGRGWGTPAGDGLCTGTS
jgi:hypothetical protein